MLDYRPCLPEHVRALRAQTEQQADHAFVIASGMGNVTKGLTFSAWLDGECVSVGGVTPTWPGSAVAWCMISPAIRPAMTSLTRFSASLFDLQPYRRLSTSVVCGFEPGHRWVKMLGFVLEAERMPAYDPVGRDCALYARVRGK